MIRILAFAIVLSASPAVALAECSVNDPAGSTLALRDAPNGNVIGEVKSGTSVNIQTTEYDNLARVWAYIGEGWVLKENISCE
jgi:hypothetical protein